MAKSKEEKILSGLGCELEVMGTVCHIFSKTAGRYSNRPYVGTFTKVAGKYHYGDRVLDDIESVLHCMVADNAVKPFAADLYSPLYNERFRMQAMLIEYMEKLDFKSNFNTSNLSFYTEDALGRRTQHLYVDFGKDMNSTKGSVWCRRSDRSVMSIPFDGLDSLIEATGSLVKMNDLLTCSDALKRLSRNSAGVGLFGVMQTDVEGLNVTTKSIREELTNHLRTALSMLENVKQD